MLSAATAAVRLANGAGRHEDATGVGEFFRR